MVRSLLRRGADVNARDRTWKTPPLSWALTGWSAKSRRAGDGVDSVVALLVASGAAVEGQLLEWEQGRADPKMLAALTGQLKAP